MEEKEFSRLDFIKSQQPRAPFADWRVYSLLIPAITSAIGFFLFAILSYSFTEFATIAAKTRFGLVIVGGVCLAFGGEVGSLTNAIEIWRKQKLGKSNRWDNTTLVISLVSTLSGFVLASAALLGNRANWSAFVQVWGAIAIGVLSALDAYGGFLETGYYFADYDTRMETWYKDLQKEQTKMSTVDTKLQPALGELLLTVTKLQSDIEYLRLPAATLAQFKDIVTNLNGQGAPYQDKPAIESVTEICKKAGLRFSGTLRTADRWYEELVK